MHDTIVETLQVSSFISIFRDFYANCKAVQNSTFVGVRLLWTF